MDGHIVSHTHTATQGGGEGSQQSGGGGSSSLQQNPTFYSSSHADVTTSSVAHSSNGICQVPLTHKANESIMTRTMHAVRDYKTAVKHGRAFKPYSKTERKVRAATRNKPWGPHGGELVELAQLSFRPSDCHVIFSVLEERLRCPPEKWRNVYKALSVLEFLVHRGSDEAVQRVSSESMKMMLEQLESFTYVTPDAQHRDVGANVRHRARAIRLLVSEPDRVAALRKNGELQSLRMAGKVVPNTDDTVSCDTSVTGDEDAKEEEAKDDADDPALQHVAAGETKGVSAEDNARHIKALKLLLQREENAVCADCGLSGPGARPTWASINLGVFLCLRCAGLHRSLGVHVSQVRSCSLDSWHYNQLELMARCGGNVQANKYWEYSLESKPMFNTVGELDHFIKDKYVEKKYICNDIEWPPEDQGLMSPEMIGILEQAMSEQQLAAAAEALAAREREDAMMETQEHADGPEEANLISLMDDDAAMPCSVAEDTKQVVLDPLEELFRDPSEDVNPPQWDMAAAFKDAEEAEEQSKEQEKVDDDHNNVTSPSSKKNAYKPFWAPLLDDGSSSATSVPLLSQGPGADFEKGFNNIPAQFTTASNVTDTNDVADTLAYLGIGPKDQHSAAKKASSISPILKPASSKPHEKKAEDYMLNMLHEFDLSSGIASVSPKLETIHKKDAGLNPMRQKT
eukprot:CAMPEP_0118799712 /NCGR_PEP_ID=MMETSP1161-20130426/1843_1 /TAXON_ID=249345 /ORGANISM="Picochlorum oklahomensis, Strain CCMP2329" /LENGTH=684 /DNA_ID=CAMNT_0006727453 /DNA_START=170 /DNA_END=2224 /DNA_ORIENTATION=-